MEKKLSLSQKMMRLRGRLKDADWRKYGATLLMGKFGAAALLVLVAIIVNPDLIGFRTFAADPNLKGNDIVNPVNTAWTLIAAFLVFGMQVGFTMLEAGFCRSRETVNVLVECVFDTCLCGLLFYAFGYAFMFGAGNGFIGWGDPNAADAAHRGSWFFLVNVPATYGSSGVALIAHWIFQFAFADTCSTVACGSMMGRTDCLGDISYSACVAGFIYPIMGHWAWGPDGFLNTM